VHWEKGKRWDILALSEGPRLPGAFQPRPDTARGARLFRNTSTDPAKPLWVWVNDKEVDSLVYGEDLQLTGAPTETSFVIGSGVMNTRYLLFDGLSKDKKTWQRQELPTPPLSYYWSAAPLRRVGKGKGFDVIAVGMSAEAGLNLRVVDVFRRGASSWTRRTLWAEDKAGQGPVRVATGDLDGNGLDDAVVLTAEGEVLLLLQGPADQWSLEKNPEMQNADKCSGFGLRIQDLDKDGRPEIAISWAGEPAGNFPTTTNQCPKGGAIKIWKLVPVPPAAK
jgi:hypothetical protein